jgi:putative ABC transport system permease protein
MTAILPGRATLALDGGAEQVPVTRASAEYFRVLRATAARGRTFLPEDDHPRAEPVVVLSDGLWRRRFGGREDVIAQLLTIDGLPTRVVGIMPPGFGAPDMDLWVPMKIDRASSERGGRSLRVLGRLASGATLARANQEMNALADRLARDYPSFNEGWGITLTPLSEATVGEGVRRALWVLLGAVGVLFVIACVNVAHLQSVRTLARGREMAIRLAIGASPWRLVRLLLVESVVLATVAGVLGLLVAAWGRDALLALAPAGLPRLHEVDLDVRVLTFGVVLVLSSAVLFGFLPAIGAISGRADRMLEHLARSRTASPSRRAAGSALVILEVGLAVVLLIGAGLLLRSFLRLSGQDPGFAPESALTFQITVPESRYRRPEDVTRYYGSMRESLRNLPGVVAVGGTHALPFTEMNSVRPFLIEGEPVPTDGAATSEYRMVTPGYFAALGIRVTRGRPFEDSDVVGGPATVVINEAFVKRYFGDGDPLGRRLRQAGNNPEIPWMTVVGVVANVRHQGLASVHQPEMYWPHSRVTWGETLNRLRRTLMIVVRTEGDPMTVAPLIRARLGAIDAQLAIGTIQPVQDLVASSAAPTRFAMLLMTAFAVLGLILALAGVYGVVSFTVASRTREFGIRLALGAAPRELLWRVLRAGFVLGSCGVAAGLGAAFLLVDLLRTQLFEVPPHDIRTFVAVAGVLLTAALAATAFPALRAARLPPVVALREE